MKTDTFSQKRIKIFYGLFKKYILNVNNVNILNQ